MAGAPTLETRSSSSHLAADREEAAIHFSMRRRGGDQGLLLQSEIVFPIRFFFQNLQHAMTNMSSSPPTLPILPKPQPQRRSWRGRPLVADAPVLPADRGGFSFVHRAPA